MELKTKVAMEDDDYCVASGVNGSNGVVGQGDLVFDDEDLVPMAMRAINLMRKNKHFCDVVLHTGSAEVPAHRAVLAAASPYLFELFTTDQDRSGSGATELPLSYKLSGHCEQRALLSLVDYAYTGKLCVPAHHVRSVYLCAWQLRMDSVVSRCGLFLASSWLSKETCLSVRALPGLTGEARGLVDKFMAENFSSLYKNSLLSALPLVQVEVLYTSRQDMDNTEHGALADLMLNWLRDQIIDEKIPVSALSGHTHLLYIAGGGELKDCAALPPAHSDTPLIQDYRRMLLKCPVKSKRNGNGAVNGTSSNGGANPRISTFYLRDILERAHRQPGDDWAIIVSETLAEHTFLSLSTLDGHLALISASLRLNESPLPSPGAVPPTVANNFFASQLTPGVAQPLAQLERPRCAYGMAVLDGKIVVCGGYDRVECLNSVETYDPEKNRWTLLPEMRQQRGRFNIAQVGNRIYAIGGSDGHVELDSVEMYQPPIDEGDSSRSMTASLESQSGSIDLSASSSIEDYHVNFATNTHNGTGTVQNGGTYASVVNGGSQRKKAWIKRAKLPIARSYAAICSGPDGKVYCLGGWAGQPGIKDCHVYATNEDVWNEMSSLNTGRYQAGACVWNGALWVVGGCDAWHCLSTTEVYRDLSSSTPGSWHFGPNLTIARRGCGVTVWGTKLAVAGGSDGQNSLRSVEFLSVGGTWESGPPMREKRAGVSLAALNDKLYAVGGFSGKLFLSTMEYLVEGSDEWTSLTIPLPAHLVPHENGRGPSPGKQDQDKMPTDVLSKMDISSNKKSSPTENDVVIEESSNELSCVVCE